MKGTSRNDARVYSLEGKQRRTSVAAIPFSSHSVLDHPTGCCSFRGERGTRYSGSSNMFWGRRRARHISWGVLFRRRQKQDMILKKYNF